MSLLFLTGTFAMAGASKEEQREDIREAASKTLVTLYESQPHAKTAVKNAAGYAVFNNFGMKIFFAGGGKGLGIAVDKSTGKETFMKMVEIQAGLGIGVKKFSVVFVFDNRTVLNQFIESGWQLGGQGTAAVKLGEEGGDLAGAMSVSPGVWLYQLTDEGVALELTGKGTKYYRDNDLNSGETIVIDRSIQGSD
jgi:lipid-binding SYLF domain-containing protein